MVECWQLMAAPFAACLVLTGIHAYLGLHVIERGVIFVDLALAQIAALGATVGFLFGFGLHHQANYLFALGFTFWLYDRMLEHTVQWINDKFSKRPEVAKAKRLGEAPVIRVHETAVVEKFEGPREPGQRPFDIIRTADLN